MRDLPKPKEVYRHFKGNDYEILSLATNSENGEQQVVYKALYPPYTVYVRPLEMFMEKVNTEKYPNATSKYRFEKMSEELKDEKQEQSSLDPRFLAFLDAETYGEKIEILDAIKGILTEDMVTSMAISIDHEVNEGTLEERIQSLRKCLLTMQMYEGSRLR